MDMVQARMAIKAHMKKYNIGKTVMAKKVGVAATTLTVFLLGGNTLSYTIDKIISFIEEEDRKEQVRI